MFVLASSEDILILASVVIAVAGTITNGLSLSYFLAKATKCLGDRLLMLLNTLDLVVCISATLKVVFKRLNENEEDNEDLDRTWVIFFVVFNFMYRVVVETTALTSTALSVSRTISLCFPFFRVKGKLIGCALSAFTVYLFVRETLKGYVLYHKRLGIDDYYLMESLAALEDGKIGLNGILKLSALTIMIAVVTLSNVISVIKLIKRKSDDLGAEKITSSNKKATVTVIILSILFCFFNTVHCVTIFCEYTDYCVNIFGDFGFWCAVPSNSAINPLVYFCRIAQMRDYLRGAWRRVTRCGAKVPGGKMPLSWRTGMCSTVVGGLTLKAGIISPSVPDLADKTVLSAL